MKDSLNILIADDVIESREALREDLEDFNDSYSQNNVSFQIEEAESFEKANQLLANSASSKKYYDIVFADIDFTEDNRGGKIDSGYTIIEKAFEICEATKICTYSGQFKGRDLWPKYEQLKNRGLVVKTFDKSHEEGGETSWMMDGLKDLMEEIESEYYLWDFWENNKLINESINNIDYLDDSFEHLDLKYSAHSNLESSYMLLRNLERFDAKETIFRLIIHLYHKSLESISRAGKDDQTIVRESDANKVQAESFLSGFKLKFNDKVTAQRLIASYITDARIKYASKLNYYRNQSIHPNRGFIPNLKHVIYANLSLALILSEDKTKIHTDNFKTLVDSESSNEEGKRELIDLISYINS